MTTSNPKPLRDFVVLPGDRQRTELTWSLPGSRVTALVTGRQSEGKLAIFEQSMVRNACVHLHINHREDESFYLIEGNYRFEVGGLLHELGPGSHIFIPRGVSHRFQYVGEKPEKC